MPLAYESERTLYRHCATIREYLRINTFSGKQARHIAVQAVYKAAQAMNPSADLINAAIGELIQNRYELPAFGTLNRIAQRVHAVVQRRPCFARSFVRKADDPPELGGRHFFGGRHF